MKQSGKRLISLIIAVAFLFAAFFVYFSLIQPAYDEVQKARAEVYGREEFIKNQKNVVEKIKAALENYENQDQIAAAVSAAIPGEADEGMVIHALSALASASNLGVQTIAPVAPSVATSKEAAGVREGGKTFSARPLGVMSFQVKLVGSYANFKTFLNKLETNIRIMDIKSVNVEEVGRANQDLYLFTVTVVAYYQNP